METAPADDAATGSRRWIVAVFVGGLGIALLVLHALHHPLARDFTVVTTTAGAPRLSKLVAIAHAVFGLGVLDAAALAIGWRLWSRDVSVEARLTIGLLVLAYATLGLASLHLLVAPALLLLLALPILLAAPRAIRWLRESSRIAQPARRTLIVAAVVAALALMPFLDAFVPRYGWDALTYHLGLPERYLHDHGIYFTPFSLYSAFPLNVEMLYAVGLALGGGALVKLINLQFGILVLCVLYRLARRQSGRAAVFTLGLVLADPLFHWELGVAYNDLAACLCALLAFEAACTWLENSSRASLVRLATFAGACVGIRVPAVVVPAALGLLLAVGCRHDLRRVTVAWAALAVGSLLALLPWLVRNAVYTRNPFSPALQDWFGTPYFDPLVVRQMFAFSAEIGVGHSPLALLTLPWTLFVTSETGHYTGSFGFAVGPLYLIGAVAALVIGRVRRDPLYGRALALTGLLVVAWFFTSQEARYLLPALLLVALAGGAALDVLAELSSRPARGLLVAVVAVGVLRIQGLAWSTLRSRYAVALGAIDPSRIEESNDAARLAAKLPRFLEPNDRLLLVLESRSFYFRGLDFIPYHVLEGSPVLRLIHDAPDPHALRCQLEQLGVTNVVVNLDHASRYHPVQMPEYGMTEYGTDLRRLEDFLHAWAQPLAQEHGVIAAKLRPVEDCSPRQR